ncbi:hypothetical protein NH288_05440 [Anaerococcus sp. NML200537]|uniref:hypothetical protein n=1 Tax=Anaerococcus sp. NML200537 TaxID=2954485 RepID=UPI002237D303|nr:hypothetical protein [Anaerococcus sp. NML200537]MCW6701527.1 hypothetical protein [Anaerococcus sp. NML200537]
MAVLENTMTSANYLKVADIDFVNIFGNKIESLQEMLGIQRAQKLNIGDTIKTYKSSVTLADGNVAPGDIIPLSTTKREPDQEYTLEYKKYRKLVPAEEIQKRGFTEAVIKSDNLMLREMQENIRNDFFTQLKSTKKSVTAKSVKDAFAQAWGNVNTAFAGEGTGTIVFVNPLDVADYLANGNIIVQQAFGLQYLTGFMGTTTTIVTSLVPKGAIYTTAPENLNLVYANVAGGEIAKAGFGFVSDKTGIIGVAREAGLDRISVSTYAMYALKLFAERTDGVFKIAIKAPAGAGA